jgi:L-rhamnose mutarotase
MTTIGFRMKLHAGAIDEYRRRHDAIWPELTNELRAAGISDYSIFVDPESLNLFAVLKLAELNKRDDLPLKPIMQRWWEYMADLMETDASKRPREWPLQLVFHMD